MPINCFRKWALYFSSFATSKLKATKRINIK
uniref:Uncharacterized protein n=1 Tax=virus sp. ctyMK1 TaxID=2828002 RepID=A0A8S5RFB6_9VIRU|nr:MAG TPA: hypothetical protein [virus sp. ctyMK1]